MLAGRFNCGRDEGYVSCRGVVWANQCCYATAIKASRRDLFATFADLTHLELEAGVQPSNIESGLFTYVPHLVGAKYLSRVAKTTTCYGMDVGWCCVGPYIRSLQSQ